MLVNLTAIEVEICKLVAETRYKTSREMGLSGSYGSIPSIDIDISGAAAEMAVSKYLDCYWQAGINTFHAADIGTEIQVRATKHQAGKLILRNRDNPEHVYFLVVDMMPSFKIAGYVEGKKAMNDKYLTNFGILSRPSCWAVPQEELKQWK